MILQYAIAGAAFFGIFVLFLVLSRTLNAMINHLVKLQYLVQKELDMKKERLEIARLLDEEKAKAKNDEESQAEAAEGQTNASLK